MSVTNRSYYDVEKEEARQERELEWRWLTLRETLIEEHEKAIELLNISRLSYQDRLQDYHDWLCKQAEMVEGLKDRW